jgi:hypothetical protein
MSGAWMFLIIFGSMWLLTRGLSGRRCGTRGGFDEPGRRESESRVSEQLAEMSARLERLEEERDFYRDLLGSGTRFRQPAEPGGSRTESSRP